MRFILNKLNKKFLVPAATAWVICAGVAGNDAWAFEPVTTECRAAVNPVPVSCREVHCGNTVQRKYVCTSSAGLRALTTSTTAAPAPATQAPAAANVQHPDESGPSLIAAGQSGAAEAVRERLARGGNVANPQPPAQTTPPSATPEPSIISASGISPQARPSGLQQVGSCDCAGNTNSCTCILSHGQQNSPVYEAHACEADGTGCNAYTRLQTGTPGTAAIPATATTAAVPGTPPSTHPTTFSEYQSASTTGSTCTPGAPSCIRLADGVRNSSGSTTTTTGPNGIGGGTGSPVTPLNPSTVASGPAAPSRPQTEISSDPSGEGRHVVTTTSQDGSGSTVTDSRYADGSQVTTTSGTGADGSHIEETSVTLGRRAEGDGYQRGAVSESNDADCKTSSAISGNYSCKGTRMAIETAKITNTLTQTAGSVATASMGQSAQQQAMAEGTQSAALRAAASTQRSSGVIQEIAGGINVAMGAIQLQRKFSHDSTGSQFQTNSKNLNLAAGSGVGVNGDGRSAQSQGGPANAQGYIASQTAMTNEIIGASDGSGSMNERSRALTAVRYVTPSGQCPIDGPDPQVHMRFIHCTQDKRKREEEYNEKKNIIARDVKALGRTAAGEQSAMAGQAMQGGMMSLMTGASQAMSGAFSIAAADQLDQAARNLKAAEGLQNQTPTFVPLGATNLTAGDAVAAGNGNSLNPSTNGAQGAQAEEENKNTPDLGSLGTPIGQAQPNTPGEGPKPGAFTPGHGGGGGAPAAGGGGGGGLSTGAAQADQGEPQAKMADQGRGGGYDGGGGGMMMGGSGGSGAASNGPDLSGMLAQFLPKKDEEKPSNNILDFGGRSPASEGPISLLDRNANIFDRVHETYQDKNRRGKVGI